MMGEWFRALITLLHLSVRAARRQAIAYVVLGLLSELILLGSLASIRHLINAAVRLDPSGATIAAALIAGLAYTHTVVSKNQFGRATTMIEKTGALLDEDLMRLSGAVVGVAQHETPDHADRIALILEQRVVAAFGTYAVVLNLRNAVQLAGGVALLGAIHPSLWFLPVFAVVSVFADSRAQRLIEVATRDTAEDLRHRQQLVELATSAAAGKEVRLFGLHGELLSRHRRLTDHLASVRWRAAARATALRAGGRTVFALGCMGAVGVVLHGAVAGWATPGDVALTVLLAVSVNGRIAVAAEEWAFLSRAVGVARHIIWLSRYSAKSVATAGGGQRAVPDRLTSGIVLDDVSFRYAGTSPLVLDHVSVSLAAGSVVALVGENGSGKTTLVKLLTRMYEPTTGRVTVDDTDLHALDVGRWRGATSAAFQDFFRFELFVREAVGLGDVEQVEDTGVVSSALDRAGAGDVKTGLPEGIETQLGRAWGGVELSAGQWQKLALARSLMRRGPLLLVLDEPTAALDPLSEHALFERFAAASRESRGRGSITLLVSHRFSTVRMADQIIVLQQGRVVEAGSHPELLARRGLYSELYWLQAQAYA